MMNPNVVRTSVLKEVRVEGPTKNLWWKTLAMCELFLYIWIAVLMKKIGYASGEE